MVPLLVKTETVAMSVALFPAAHILSYQVGPTITSELTKMTSLSRVASKAALHAPMKPWFFSSRKTTMLWANWAFCFSKSEKKVRSGPQSSTMRSETVRWVCLRIDSTHRAVSSGALYTGTTTTGEGAWTSSCLASSMVRAW